LKQRKKTAGPKGHAVVADGHGRVRGAAGVEAARWGD
jgi:hypothetical protein